ncbi:MAG: hypothetical protein JNK93_17355 [Planctomycetia bacterium]|nr:hypothetical protein [Planctomycetia bacterium]
MPPRLKLRCLNVVLIGTFVALCLACGGDPEDPPRGSIWEKLCGYWASDPVPLFDGDREVGTTVIKLEMSYWNVGLIMHYPGEAELRVGESVGEWAKSCSAEGFQGVGSVATSDPAKSRDGSTWSFRVDPDQPEVMYATWTLKNGTKRLDGVRFKKYKK